MKELTTEQKAQIYAYKIVTVRFGSNVADKLFPKLKESKESGDEEIRNFISNELACLRAADGKGSDRYEELTKAINWLKKQGEQKLDTDFSDLRTWKYIVDAVWTEKEGIGQYLDSPFTEEVAKKLQKRFGNIEQKPADKEFTFKAIPRLLDMIEPTDRAKSYCQKLIDSLKQEGYSTDAKIVRDCLKQMNGEKVAMATMDEQEHTDKTKPKFKVGDWIVYKDNVWKICNISLKTYYELLKINNEVSIRHFEGVDKTAHLWTIQDAKDGDVLVCNGDIKYERICLFKNLDSAFFTLTKASNYVEKYDIDATVDYPDNTVPATKEQKEILFMAMKGAGYTFDFEKKELKRIEQKSAVWSEEDEKMYRGLHNLIYSTPYCDSREEFSDWFKSLKDRIQTKQEWSEEDKYYYDIIQYILNNECVGKTDKENAINWFKSLRPQKQWKPSDEQIYSLDRVLRFYGKGTAIYDSVKDLIEQLMKLREE